MKIKDMDARFRALVVLIVLVIISPYAAFALRKNVAGQRECQVMYTISTGQPKTTGTVEVLYTHTNGTVETSAGNATQIGSAGMWCIDLSAAQTNSDSVSLRWHPNSTLDLELSRTYATEYDSNVLHINGTTQTGTDLGGYLTTHVNGTLADGTHPVNVAQTGDAYGYVSTHLNGSLAAGNHVAQTGDTYALANDGTSGFVALHNDGTLIQAKTNSLTFTVAGKVDANATHVNGTLQTARDLGAGVLVSDGAITSATIATNAIGADELAAGGVTEIQAGLAATGEAETAFTSRTTGGLGTEFLAPLLALAPGGGTGDWTANQKTALMAILGVPASGSTPEAPSAGVLFDIDADVEETLTRLPDATAGAAGGLFIAGTNAATTITSATGPALTISSTGANGTGLVVSGNGSGSGLSVTGGETGDGVTIAAGASGGYGIGVASTDNGIQVDSSGGNGVRLNGNTVGLYANGGDFGVVVNGNSEAGAGFEILSDGYGLDIISTFAPARVESTFSATGKQTLAVTSDILTAVRTLTVDGSGTQFLASLFDLAPSPWATPVPGSWEAGTAGYLLGNLLQIFRNSQGPGPWAK